MRPLTILFTYYPRDPEWDRLQRVHWKLLCHHNPGSPVVPLVCNGAEPFLPGTVDVGRIDDPMYNVDRMPALWWKRHRTPETDAARFAVIESDCLVTEPLWKAFAPAWGADVAGAVVADPDVHPEWVWWAEVEHLPLRFRSGIMPAGVVMYSRLVIEVLSRSDLACMAEARIGTAAKIAGLDVAEVPGLRRTVHCRPDMIELSGEPGVYHPVKVYGGPDGSCRAAHEFGLSLLREHPS